MPTLTYGGMSWNVDHAVKGTDYVHGYDAKGNVIVSIDGIEDFSLATFDGAYMRPDECLAERENTVMYCNGKMQTTGGKDVSLSGVGSHGEYITCCHNVFKSGFYAFDEAYGIPFDYGVLEVSGIDSTTCNQTAVCTYGSEKGAIVTRKYAGGRGLKLRLWCGDDVGSSQAFDLGKGLDEYFTLGLEWVPVSGNTGKVQVYVDGALVGSESVKIGTRVQNADTIAMYYKYANCCSTDKNRVNIKGMKLTVGGVATALSMNFNQIGNFKYFPEDDLLRYTNNGPKTSLAYCVDKNSTQASKIDASKTVLYEQVVSIIDMPSGSSEMSGVREGAGYFINIEDSTAILISAMIYNEGETDWEYINPPLVIGNSYRTTDRYNGLVVYKRMTSDGVLQWSTDLLTWNTYAAQISAVPTSRKVNGKALSSNITLSSSDVGAVPTTRTVNGKALSSNISLSAGDVGAAASSHNHSASNITSGTLPVARGGTGVTTEAAIGLRAYPVGSIYMSVNSTSPASLFGGTWTQLKDRFLLGAGSTYTNGSTGGAATHALTIAEMPTHRHSISHYASVVAAGADKTVWSLNAENERTSTAYDTGGNGAHNNMPPYLVVYMWKRTA